MANKRNYTVFIRNWWAKDGKGNLYPHTGRKKTVRRGLSIEEARKMCTEYNNSNDPGPLSRKMEFESY